MKSALTVEQRLFVLGEQGICPECEREVEWSQVDTEWGVCTTCMGKFMAAMHENKSDDHMAGYMDGMGELLKSVLTEMIRKGDPELAIIKKTIHDVEVEMDVKL